MTAMRRLAPLAAPCRREDRPQADPLPLHLP